MHNDFGLVNVSAATPHVTIGDPMNNVVEIIKGLCELVLTSDIIVFPELSITGYSCKDLFFNEDLINDAWEAVNILAKGIGNRLVVVGCPILANGRLYNCAVVMNKGKIVGIVPKSSLPTYKEFEEARFFSSGKGIKDVELTGEIPFGVDLLFNCEDIIVGVEICEDAWTPIPPSSHQALSGANILLNLSASTDLVGKDEYRRNLIANQSGRCVAGYVYACAGPSESTTDTVMSAHNIIAVNGTVLIESTDGDRYKPGFIECTIDIGSLKHQRISATSFGQTIGEDFNIIPIELDETETFNPVPANPFLEGLTRKRKSHILDIQAQGLVQRLRQLPDDVPVTIGVSGGLDSTLALLVTVEAFKLLGRDPSEIMGITMPGFGTTETTKTNAEKLMDLLGVAFKNIDITDVATDILTDISHSGEHDLTFQNVQARYRTLLLMSHGFVVGTGDMSEIALGWCTYNGDHASMYNVNCGVPKTLVKELVKHHIVNGDSMDQGYFSDPVGVVLQDIVDTEISPELLPEKDGKAQSTEDTLGPYALHDFFLLHFVRDGYGIDKMVRMAELSTDYDLDIILDTLEIFITRFFRNQFKKSCVPDGPKVGSVSLSPRGDWRMASDASAQTWLRKINTIRELTKAN